MATQQSNHIENMQQPEFRVCVRLYPIYRRLERILAHLWHLNARSHVTFREIGRVQNDLHQIDQRYREAAVWISGDIPEGQAEISELIERAHLIAHAIVCRLPDVEPTVLDARLDKVQKKLQKIIVKLEEVLITKDASSKDIGRLQNELHRLEDSMQGLEEVEGFEVVKERLETAYVTVHNIITQVPQFTGDMMMVDPALKKIVMKLQLIIEELESLAARPPEEIDDREIGRVQNKVSNVDDEYVEGAIRKHGQIVRGQAIVSGLLNDAHSLIEEIHSQME